MWFGDEFKALLEVVGAALAREEVKKKAGRVNGALRAREVGKGPGIVFIQYGDGRWWWKTSSGWKWWLLGWLVLVRQVGVVGCMVGVVRLLGVFVS